jgi:NhaP-type Na+/H+ or K+/H+ antiporter
LRSWATTWRLLGVAMPITILAVTLLAVYALELPVAMALLLGRGIGANRPGARVRGASRTPRIARSRCGGSKFLALDGA